MRRIKITTALILLAAVLLGVAGCSKANTLTRQDFIAELEAYGIPKTDDFRNVSIALSRNGGDNAYYVAVDKEEAGKLSNVVLNRFKKIDEIKAEDFVIAFVMEKGSNDKFYSAFACCMTFGSGKTAENTYNNLVDGYAYKKDGKSGKQSGISYFIESRADVSKKNKTCTGIYLQGKTVIYLRAQAMVEEDNEFVERICGKFGLISPSKAK